MLSSYFKNARLELSYKSFRMKNTGGSALENELKSVYIDQVLPLVETFFSFSYWYVVASPQPIHGRGEICKRTCYNDYSNVLNLSRLFIIECFY